MRRMRWCRSRSCAGSSGAIDRLGVETATGSARLVVTSVGGWAPASAQRDRRFLVIENACHPNYEGRAR